MPWRPNPSEVRAANYDHDEENEAREEREDDVSWQHLRDTYPTARKEYHCFLCGLPIRVGTKHVQRSGVGDGGLDSFRLHELCESKAARWSINDWECFSDGEQSEFRVYELTADERASLESTPAGAKS